MTVPFIEKAAELGKTKLHAKKESCDFLIFTYIPRVCVMFSGAEKFHVLICFFHLRSMKNGD
jgi:hypothetical protein